MKTPGSMFPIVSRTLCGPIATQVYHSGTSHKNTGRLHLDEDDADFADEDDLQDPDEVQPPDNIEGRPKNLTKPPTHITKYINDDEADVCYWYRLVRYRYT